MAGGKTSVRPAKKEKDPSAPKKPLTSFFVFLKYRRPEIKQANPNFSVTEITKLLGAEWKKMTPEMRARYKDTETESQPA